MSETGREQRLQIMLSDVELEALDTWRFQARMPSRAAAVRELLKRGLAAEGFVLATPGKPSRDYGMMTAPDSQKKKTRTS